MPVPNLFILYVSDVEASTAFYNALFDMEPQFISPRFVEYEVAAGVGLALWSGGAAALESAGSRTSEVCLNLPGGPQQIEDHYNRWQGLGVDMVQGPHDDVFGRTFLAKDPDGNLLRVAPVDPTS